jgi:L-amino acid N-acyltransferase YncA/predicted O-methyltransferase YrrM
VNVIIRDAVEADLPAITEIYNTAIATRMATAQVEPVTLEQQRYSLGEHSPERYPFWVADLDGRVIGWLSFKAFLPRCAYRGTAEISVYIDEEFRRRGVAQQLLQEAIVRAPSLGISALVGLIFGHNEPSLTLFERLGFQRWGLLPGIARIADAEGDLIVMGRHCPPRSETTKEYAVQPLKTSSRLNECLNLMYTLMEYRHKPIHSKMLKIRDRYSMLHLDALLLIYHFAKICPGHILEIGAFVGGATIAAAFGVRDSGKRKLLITIEPGGKVKHKRLGTRDILRDLERNLAKQGVSDLVTIIKGRSFDPAIISAVNEALGSNKIGLLILDADAGKRRDVDRYREKFAEGCWMVIDDYYGADANAKIAPSRADVEALTAAGYLEPLGFYGWSTWVGRWVGGATQANWLKK